MSEGGKGRIEGGKEGGGGWVVSREGGRDQGKEGGRDGGRHGRSGRTEGDRTGGREDGREGGRKGGKEGFGPGMVMHISMPVVVSIHSAMTCWREGLRAVGR